jgi:holo-[acyl-carrier protein] synthase
MVFGIGCDLVSISRIDAALARWQKRFRDRIFTDGEQHYCDARTEAARHYAARFAAKEAFYKAIARGRDLPLVFVDAEVVAGEGEMGLRLSPHAAEIARKEGVAGMHLSLTHDGDYALAFVILER